MTGNDTRLGPDDLVRREFAIGLRGYDRDEVDAFLRQAADAWRTSLSATPTPINGLSSSAVAALAGSRPDDEHHPEASPTDPFAAPVAAGAFAAPTPPPSAGPSTPAPGPLAPTEVTDPPDAATPETPSAPEPAETDAEAADPPVAGPASEGTRAEAERDRTTAYAERKAAELDRAQARTELAQAQEEALHVVDQAQRRAEAVLSGAHDRARAEAEAVLEDARSRLTPLLEQEHTVRARLDRLRQELAAMADGAGADQEPALPPAEDLVDATEDDPETPAATFPVGYGSISVGS